MHRRVEEVLSFVGLREYIDRMPSELSHQLQDAFYVATHKATRVDGTFAIAPAASHESEEVSFLLLRDGRIYLEGHAAELLTSDDSYLKAYLSGWVPPLVA